MKTFTTAIKILGFRWIVINSWGAPILQPGVIKLLQKKKHQLNFKEWKANMGKHNDIFVLFINYRKVTASTLFHISGIAVSFRLIANNNFPPI